jgi:DNA repair exonuclease SbcCD ATPase subunit
VIYGGDGSNGDDGRNGDDGGVIVGEDDDALASKITLMSDVNSPSQWSSYINAQCPSLNVDDWIFDAKKILMDTTMNLPQALVDKIVVRNAKIQKELDTYDAAIQSLDTQKYTVKLKYMEWSYLMCFGADNRVDFDSFEGTIALLNGRNATGKSSFLDVLCIGLYGMPTSSRHEMSDVKMSANIIHDDKPAMASSYATIVFMVNDTKYMIKRCVSEVHDKSRSHSEIIHQLDDSTKTSCVVAEGSQMVNEWIIRRFGTIQEMLMSSVICQMDNTSFFFLPSTVQKDILDKSMNLQTVSAYQSVLDEAIKAYKYVIGDIATYIEGMKAGGTRDTAQDSARDVKVMEAELANLKEEMNVLSLETTHLTTMINEYHMKIGTHPDRMMYDAMDSYDTIVEQLERLTAEQAAQNFINIDTESKTQLLVDRELLRSQLDAIRGEGGEGGEDGDNDSLDMENYDEIIAKRNADLHAHDARRPEECDITLDEIHTTTIEYNIWVQDQNPDMMSRPERVRDALLDIRQKLKDTEEALANLLNEPVEKPRHGTHECSVDCTDLKDLRALTISAHSAYTFLAQNQPSKSKSRDEVLSVVTECNEWIESHYGHMDMDMVMDMNMENLVQEERTLSTQYHRLVSNAVGKPSEDRLATGAHGLELPETVDETLQHIRSIEAKMALMCIIPVTTAIPDIAAWEKELCDHDIASKTIPAEDLSVMVEARDSISKNIDDLRTLYKYYDEVRNNIHHYYDKKQNLKDIPVNHDCWACKSNNETIRDRITEINRLISQWEDSVITYDKKIKQKQKRLIALCKLSKDTKSSSVDVHNADDFIEKCTTYLDTLNNDIQRKEQFEKECEHIRVQRDARDREKMRIAGLEKYTHDKTVLAWHMYDVWNKELCDLKTRCDSVTHKIQDAQHYNDVISLRLKDASRELERCAVWTQWDEKCREWKAMYENCAWSLWIQWSREKEHLQNEIHRLKELEEGTCKFLIEYDSWTKEMNNVSVKSTQAMEWSLWTEKKEVLFTALQKTLWKRQWIDLHISLNEIENGLIQCQLYESYNKQLDSLRKQMYICELDEKVQEHKAKYVLLANVQKRVVELEHDLASVHGQSTLTQTYGTYRKILKERYEKLVKLRDVFIGAKGTSDGFKATVYRERVIPLIEHEVNTFLEELDNFRFKVCIVNNKLHYSVVDRGNTIQLGHCSGYQKFIIGLAMRAALCRIGAAGQSLKHIMIDEGFGCCDSINIQRAHQVVYELMRTGKYVSIILMSHLDTVREISQKTINIVRDEGRFSYIRYGVNAELNKYTKVVSTCSGTNDGKKTRGRPSKIK